MALSLELNLKAIRRKRGITGRQLALQLGVHFNTISRIERGYGASLEDALKLAAFYGVRVEDIWRAH